LGFYRRYRDTFLVVLLLAVPFFFLRASIRAPEELNAVDRVLVRVATPVQYMAASIARGVSDLVSEYFYLVDVGRDNNRLSREVARLRQSTQELASLKKENDRLRGLMGLRETVPVETVSASITTKTPTEFFRVAHVVVDHNGAAIRENMPVISTDGVVGLVKRVHGDSATVFLVAEAGFGVDVVVPRTGARGYVRGNGDESNYVVKVDYTRRADEISVGDIFVTSGKGFRFPPGIPVAKVTEVVKRDFGEYQQVVAEPTVDFSRLEEVLIVTGEVKECLPAEKVH
jgi:rod shape-determining protein MreC